MQPFPHVFPLSPREIVCCFVKWFFHAAAVFALGFPQCFPPICGFYPPVSLWQLNGVFVMSMARIRHSILRITAPRAAIRGFP